MLFNENIKRIKNSIKENVHRKIIQENSLLIYYTIEQIINNIPLAYIFLDFINYYPLFRVILNGYHITENIYRIKNNNIKYFTLSLLSAIRSIDNLIYNNISILTDDKSSIAIFVYDNKDNKNLLLMYPVDISISSYLSSQGISNNYIDQIKINLESNNNTKIKELSKNLIKNHLCNGYNRLTTYLYNSYYIPTILSPDMKMKGDINKKIYLNINDIIKEDKDLITGEKIYFINSMIDNILNQKIKNIQLTENYIIKEQKNWYHIKLHNYFDGYIDKSKVDYIIFPEKVNINKLKIINLYLEK